MTRSRSIIQDAVSKIDPIDTLESDHKQDVLKWIDSSTPIFRISKPDNPPKHLVSYFVLYDETASSVMLIDHIKARLWLPTGGHVEVDENPLDTVIREADEELQIKAGFDTPFGSTPLFITVTLTKGLKQHTDVSLWYVIKGDAQASLNFDVNEMNSCKWFTLDEVLAIDVSELDPHMHRFVEKMKTYLTGNKKMEAK